jgi:hypothetical protein
MATAVFAETEKSTFDMAHPRKLKVVHFTPATKTCGQEQLLQFDEVQNSCNESVSCLK